MAERDENSELAVSGAPLSYGSFLKSVNLRIFGWDGKASLFSVFGGLVVVLTLVSIYTKFFSTLCGSLGLSFASHAARSDFEVGLMSTVVFGVYAVLFGLHAARDVVIGSAAASSTLADLGKDNQALSSRVQALERDKEHLVPKMDFRDQLAAAVGVKFTSVNRTCNLINIEGTAEIRHEERFVVSSLRLADLVRRIGSDCKHQRHDPVIEIAGLPDEVRFSSNFKDLSEEAGVREYRAFFDPPLEAVSRPVTLIIREQMDKAFYMYREDVPSDWPKRDRAEHVGHLVFEPVENLSLHVEFPRAYDIRKEDFFIQVTYGRGATRHAGEEARLAQGDALKYTRHHDDGAPRAALRIDKPLLGLAYYLCWIPLPKPTAARGGSDGG